MAWVNYSIFFVRRDAFAERTATPFLLVTTLLQGVYVAMLGAVFRHHLMASVFEVFAVIALALNAVYLIVETRHRNKSMGVFILPFSALFQLISSVWISPSREIDPVLRDPLFGFHTGSAAVAYSAFLISAVYGAMYRVFYRALRARRFGLVFERLPSLEVLARMTLGAASVGFAFLTFAIFFGAVWAARVVPSFWIDPKFLLTLLVWGIYGAAVISQRLLRQASNRTIAITLAGFFVMVVSFVSLHLFFPTFHEFGG
jgi:ABC-type uncharacterized transport system permease subunit